jgi:hypothetical protein
MVRSEIEVFHGRIAHSLSRFPRAGQLLAGSPFCGALIDIGRPWVWKAGKLNKPQSFS